MWKDTVALSPACAPTEADLATGLHATEPHIAPSEITFREEHLGAPPHQQSDRVHLLGPAVAHVLSKRLRVPESALCLVNSFKLVLRLSLNWREINAPNQLRLLLVGHQFQDGRLVLEETPTLVTAFGA